MQFEFFQLFELLSLLVAIVCYRGLKQFSLVAFVPLLVIINVMESIGVNYEPNYFVYNMLILLQTPFFLFLYGKMLMLRDNELTVFRVVSALTLFFILFNYFFGQGQVKFTNYSFILIQVLNIVLSCLVLLRLYMLETKNVILLISPYFWINAANLLFGLAVLVLLGLQDYIIKNNIKIGNDSLYRYILPFATIVLYSFYSYAFVLCRKRISK